MAFQPIATLNALPSDTQDDRRFRKSLLPKLDELPIPERFPLRCFTEQMEEMADHVGGNAVLLLCAKYGGQQLYISQSINRSAIVPIIGLVLGEIFHTVYGGNRFLVPNARAAIATARRAGIIAGVREGLISAADAAIVLGTSRTYLSHLVNGTDEGVGVPPTELPVARPVLLVQLAAKLAELQLLAAGASLEAVERVTGAIMRAADASGSELAAALAYLAEQAPTAPANPAVEALPAPLKTDDGGTDG